MVIIMKKIIFSLIVFLSLTVNASAGNDNRCPCQCDNGYKYTALDPRKTKVVYQRPYCDCKCHDGTTFKASRPLEATQK